MGCNHSIYYYVIGTIIYFIIGMAYVSETVRRVGMISTEDLWEIWFINFIWPIYILITGVLLAIDIIKGICDFIKGKINAIH